MPQLYLNHLDSKQWSFDCMMDVTLLWREYICFQIIIIKDKLSRGSMLNRITYCFSARKIMFVVLMHQNCRDHRRTGSPEEQWSPGLWQHTMQDENSPYPYRSKLSAPITSLVLNFRGVSPKKSSHKILRLYRDKISVFCKKTLDKMSKPLKSQQQSNQ